MQFLIDLIAPSTDEAKIAQEKLLYKIKTQDKYNNFKKIKSFSNPTNGDLNALMLFVRKHGDDDKNSTIYLSENEIDDFISYTDLSYISKNHDTCLLLELCLADKPIPLTDIQWNKIIKATDLSKTFSIGERNAAISPFSYLLSKQQTNLNIPIHIVELIVNKTIHTVTQNQSRGNTSTIDLTFTPKLLLAKNDTVAKNLSTETTINLLRHSNLNKLEHKCQVTMGKYNTLSFALKYYAQNNIIFNSEIFEYLINNTDLSQKQHRGLTAVDILSKQYDESFKQPISKASIEYLLKNSPNKSLEQTKLLANIIKNEDQKEKLHQHIADHYQPKPDKQEELAQTKEQLIKEIKKNNELKMQINKMQALITKQAQELKYRQFLTPNNQPSKKL